MKPAVLQMLPLSANLEARLRKTFQIISGWDTDTSRLAQPERDAISGIVTHVRAGVPNAILERLPNVKVISCQGVGMDKIDLAYAKARGIQVAGSFGVLSDCVADFAFGLLIDAARRIAASDRFVRASRWPAQKMALSTRVSGKKIGIFGLGQIGQRIARRATGFDMDIRYTNRRPRPDVPYLFEPSLEALARWADFLVIAAPGSPQTHHMVSTAILEALGPDGYVINIARGSIIDTDALTQALSTHKIAGAGLDVVEGEPEVPPALLAFENVVFAPHIAGATRETRAAVEDRVFTNLQSFYAHGKVLTPAF